MPRIIKLLDGFVPKHMRNNPADLMRAYMLVGVIFSNILTGVLTTIGLLSLIHLPHNTFLAVQLAMLFLMVVYIASLAYFRISQDYHLVGNLMVGAVWLLIVFAIAISGGYQESPVLPVLGMLPVMGFLLTGINHGIRWLAATVITCLAFYILPGGKRGYMQLIPLASDRQTMSAVLQTILLLVTGCALLVYEVINENLKHKLNQERDEFERRASIDSLTGIPNRFEFFRRLNSGLSECRDRGQKLAVAYIDLDHFKPINDHYGHQAGDVVLQSIAKRLRHVLRLSDTAARLGGDEFGLILPGIRVPEDLAAIMQKVEKTIAEPINIGNKFVAISGSIGVAIYPDHAVDIDQLCAYADSAMYVNKTQQHDAGISQVDSPPSTFIRTTRSQPRTRDH